MIEVEIPGWRSLRLANLILDVNGTLTLDGELLDGVAERLGALRGSLDLHLLSADTFGRLDAIASRLGVAAVRLRAGGAESEQKSSFVSSLDAATVAAIGNGANDLALLAEAALGLAVLGPEGAAPATLLTADVVCSSITDALDLLLQPRRLIATLRR